ncbi:hypothetical protein RRG08_041987 [Elysia crispata]|uniref:Uncharacterized protein n=1 Tax=Elysia crispata TaxID=231223 RepID=A0AAE0Z0S5_9GAST|nr:hypothetical protein RRG08_041987 [Elysia crispata]
MTSRHGRSTRRQDPGTGGYTAYSSSRASQDTSEAKGAQLWVVFMTQLVERLTAHLDAPSSNPAADTVST